MTKCSNDEVEHLKVKNLCVKEGKIKNLKSKNAEIEKAKVETLKLEGYKGDITCFLKAGTANNFNVGFDCMDCDRTPENPYGNPIKPDFLDQDVWDFLICNLRTYQEQLAEDFLEGRTQIRCIKEAYGCDICPPDCPIPEGCPENCPEPPNCSVPAECIPDPFTCDPRVNNFLFATETVPPYIFSCGSTGSTGPTGPVGSPDGSLQFNSTIGFNLNINNVTCTLSPRVATVMVQIAYKGTGTTGPNERCEKCEGETGPIPLTCACDTWEGPDINCNIVNVMCKQFQSTININLGENFSGNIVINTQEIKNIFNQTKNATDKLPAAIQLVVFLEGGLEVSSNGTRGGGEGGGGANTFTSYNPT